MNVIYIKGVFFVKKQTLISALNYPMSFFVFTFIYNKFQDEIFSMQSIQSIIESCRTLCSFANMSNNFCTALEKAQLVTIVPKITLQCMQDANPEGTVLYLKQDVKTRWNSTYLMLQRLVACKSFNINCMLHNFNLVTAQERCEKVQIQ